MIMSMLLAGCDRRAPLNLERQNEEAQYAKWHAYPENAKNVASLHAYLTAKGVGDVIPVQQLVRSDVNWKRCNAPQFLVPPRTTWAHLVPTLRLLRDDVAPRLGAVEALSVYRSPSINSCLKGAPQSSHMAFHALDLRFAKSRSREDLIVQLCGLHRRVGAKRKMGLGIYKGDRFHIDTNGFRSWGHDQRGATSPCFDISLDITRRGAGD